MELARSKNGLIHVLSPSGSGEYTFCGLEMQEGSGDPGMRESKFQDNSLEMVTGCLPNCKECKESIRQIREVMKEVRFSKKLRSIYDEDYDNENGDEGSEVQG